jgi:hypothetical protein
MEAVEIVSTLIAFQIGHFHRSHTYRLARWAVKWVSDCRCAGSEGSEDWAWAGALAVLLPAMMEEEAIDLSAVRPIG